MDGRQRIVFARGVLEHGVLPVRVAFACEALDDDDLERVRRAFRHGCTELARFLDRVTARFGS